VENRTG